MDTGAMFLSSSWDIALLSDKAQPKKYVLPCWKVYVYLHPDLSSGNDSSLLSPISRTNDIYWTIITFENYSDIDIGVRSGNTTKADITERIQTLTNLSTSEIRISTARRSQFVSITFKVNEVISSNCWQDGVITIFVPHTTAAITINENADPDVARDMEWFCNQLVPQSKNFRHNEGNSDAHIKASFYGSSIQVIVRNGKMWLGTWQGIYFCEFDGPRERKVYVAFTSWEFVRTWLSK
jgi:secondary thiamine-phosphate synthase enzyme